MIRLLIAGGLGNQMFQYAFAKSLSLYGHTTLKISCRFLANDDFGRKYSLHHLSLPESCTMSHAEELRAHAEMYIARKLGLHKLSRKYIYVKQWDAYSPEYFGRTDAIVQGYFQSAKNFRAHDEVIRRELRVSAPASPENQAVLHELTSCESVCVHVRRGDYLTLKFGNVCGRDYYSRAVNYIAEHVKNPVYYFFSNTHEDIIWLRENYSFPGYDVRYVDLNNPDYEELRLMYSCRHFIIANSSMSWWASYLADNPAKVVCAPSQWMGDFPITETNIYLPSWVIIDAKKDENS